MVRWLKKLLLLSCLLLLSPLATTCDDWEKDWLPPMYHRLHCTIIQEGAHYYVHIRATSRDGKILWGPRLYAATDKRMKALEECDDWMKRVEKIWQKRIKDQQKEGQ